MVPLLFASFARRVAECARDLNPQSILETAAGTGVVTSALAEYCPHADIVATDLNAAMLEVAAQRPGLERITIETADALALPFGEKSFDLVVCQFGAMFYPDKVRANYEALRVLKRGGHYLAVLWDGLNRNPVSAAVNDAVAALFPDDPPDFFPRVPFGYADRDRLRSDLTTAGFVDVALEDVVSYSLPICPSQAAIGLVQGSPLRNEIESRDASRLAEATNAAARAIALISEGNQVTAPMSAIFVLASAP